MCSSEGTATSVLSGLSNNG